MFKELQPLLSTVASLTVSMVENADGTITLTIIPNGVKKGCNFDSQMQMTGTASELDEGFTAHLIGYTAKRQSLADQLAATEAILEAQKKEAAEKAKKSIAKSTKPDAGNTQSSDDDEQADEDESGESNTTPASTDSDTSTAPTSTAPAAKSLWE